MSERTRHPVNRRRLGSGRYSVSQRGKRSQDMDLTALKGAILLQRRANTAGQNVASRRVYQIRPDSP